MKVSEYIEQLERLKELHGDLRVYKMTFNGFEEVKYVPDVAHAKILSKREFKGKKWDTYMDESEKGEKVIHV